MSFAFCTLSIWLQKQGLCKERISRTVTNRCSVDGAAQPTNVSDHVKLAGVRESMQYT